MNLKCIINLWLLSTLKYFIFKRQNIYLWTDDDDMFVCLHGKLCEGDETKRRREKKKANTKIVFDTLMVNDSLKYSCAWSYSFNILRLKSYRTYILCANEREKGRGAMDVYKINIWMRFVLRINQSFNYTQQLHTLVNARCKVSNSCTHKEYTVQCRIILHLTQLTLNRILIHSIWICTYK